jgi:hypothetical protein
MFHGGQISDYFRPTLADWQSMPELAPGTLNDILKKAGLK